MISINGICYIAAACRENSDNIFLNPQKTDIVIAADGGYEILKEKGICPDILLGDFDSIENLPDHENIIKHPVEKDDTDTMLACKLGFEKNYSNFVIYGGVGGRIDHTLANVQTLLWVAKRGGRAFLMGDNVVMSTIHNQKMVFPSGYSGKISVFAQGNTAKGVKISGFKYFAENIDLTPDFPLGVSNEFVGERAEISVKNGTLLIVWEQKSEDFIKKIDGFIGKTNQ